MELKIINVFNKSTPEEEYVWIKVLEKTNLKYFILCDNTFDEQENLSNKHQHFYRFPATDVEAGDYLALYTKLNPKYKRVEDRKKGGTTYRFDWGLGSCVWNNEGDTAHLVKISGLASFKVKKAGES